MTDEPRRVVVRLSASLHRWLKYAAEAHDRSLRGEIEMRLEQSERTCLIERLAGHVLESRIERLDIRPGDIVVLSVPENLNEETAIELRERLTRQLGSNNKAIVLTRGLTVASLSAEEIAAQTAGEAAE